MKNIFRLGFLAFFLVLLNSCYLFRPSSNKMYARALKKHPQYDAIIVPGVPFVDPEWDRIMQMRVLWSVNLFKKGIAKNIIMSGSSVYSPYVEAKIMKLYAIELGVPEQNIFVEEKAEHSTENIWYGYKMAKAKGFNTVALATDPFQTKLLYRFVRKRTKDLARLPVLFDTLKTMMHTNPPINYLPYKIPNFVALPDRESKWQRWRGTNGKHINYNEK